MIATSDMLSLVSVNAVGDFFRAEIDHRELKFLTKEQLELFHAEHDLDQDLTRDHSSANPTTKLNPIFPSELFSPYWLFDSSSLSGSGSYKEIIKEETEKWERQHLNPIHRRWSKINFATDIMIRNSLPNTNDENRYEISVIEKPLEVVQPLKMRGGRPKKLEIVVSTEPSPIPLLPRLLAVDESAASGYSLDILKIFDGDDEDLFADIDPSDDESQKLLKPPSSLHLKSNSRVSQSERSEPVRPISEVAETMLDFAAGLHQVLILSYRF
jgi:hypothetical protein